MSSTAERPQRLGDNTQPGRSFYRARSFMDSMAANLEITNARLSTLLWLGIVIFVGMVACVFAVSFGAAYIVKDTSTAADGTLTTRGSGTAISTKATGSHFAITPDVSRFVETTSIYDQNGVRRAEECSLGDRAFLGEATKEEVERAWTDALKGITVMSELVLPGDVVTVVFADVSGAQMTPKAGGSVSYTGGKAVGHEGASISCDCNQEEANCQFYEVNCYFHNMRRRGFSMKEILLGTRRSRSLQETISSFQERKQMEASYVGGAPHPQRRLEKGGTGLDVNKIPRHVAIIPDGNRRWSKINHLTSAEGHMRGADQVYDSLNFLAKFGVKYFTVYSISTENMEKRSADELVALFGIIEDSLNRHHKHALEKGYILQHIGDLDDPRVPKSFRATVLRIEESTREGAGDDPTAIVSLAFNYGGRTDIARAVRDIAAKAKSGALDPKEVDADVLREHMWLPGVPDPDLVIRTGGGRRLSNFLLWNAAYAELYLTDTLWPDCGEECLLGALFDYSQSQRKLGGDGDGSKHMAIDPQGDTSPKALAARKDPAPACRESPMGRLVRRSSSNGLFTDCNSASFWGGHGRRGMDNVANVTGNEAVCEFVNFKYTGHFPFGMQQLYRCFSFWQASAPKRPILLMDLDHQDMNYRRDFSGKAFYKGIIEGLVNVFGVELRDTNEPRRLDGHRTNQVSTELYDYASLLEDDNREIIILQDKEKVMPAQFAMCDPQHARALSSGILSSQGKGDVVAASINRRRAGVPRVVIANRDPFFRRSISNLHEVGEALVSASQGGELFTVSPDVYFEGLSRSFLEQAAFFHSNDIIVTGHGAQLTGMAFMPECGSVLELFPEGYCVNEYFGSLASAAGLSHSYFYMSDDQDDDKEGCDIASFDYHGKTENLCPPVDKLVEGILMLVQEWKECAGGSSD